MVSVGIGTLHINQVKTDYHFLVHNDLPERGRHIRARSKEAIQKSLDECTLFIAHNAKYDLAWLHACGFIYTGKVWCTMLAEYVLMRAVKKPLTLEACCKRRNVALKKSALIDQYYKDKIQMDAIPIEIVEEYGVGDIVSCGELYMAQRLELQLPDNVGLLPTIELMNGMCVVLEDIENNGMAIDFDALDEIEDQFRIEKNEVEKRLMVKIRAVMGDRPINLSSSEHLSQVIFSRKIDSKLMWSGQWFESWGKPKKPKNRRISKQVFQEYVRMHTSILKKQRAEQCIECRGVGRIRKKKKDGSAYKNDSPCHACDSTGLTYIDLPEVAGFKINPVDANWVSALGFGTSKGILQILSDTMHDAGNEEGKLFFDDLRRFNALSTYLTSFVNGIRKGMFPDGYLHADMNQTRTFTGRLSSSNPNQQNFPRGNTFPIKRCFVSRFKGVPVATLRLDMDGKEFWVLMNDLADGCMTDADYAQLEFRAAAHQSGDKVAIAEIMEGFDVHTFTQSCLATHGLHLDRTSCKSRTFMPLYGGMSGTKAEVAYFKAFLAKYEGITEWQTELQEEAIKNGKIVLPTGREYAFPSVKRNPWGGATEATKIKNYPVQGFATGDIVPLACVLVHRELKARKLRSLFVNTVHDSLLVDTYPGEEKVVAELMVRNMRAAEDVLYELHGIKMLVPLLADVQQGPNWMEMKEVILD